MFMGHYSQIFPYLNDGIMSWVSCVHRYFICVFILQNKSIRIWGKTNYRDSCRETFKTMSIWLLQVFSFSIKHFTVVKKDNLYRETPFTTIIITPESDMILCVQKHWTTFFTKHLYQAEVKLFNLLPDTYCIIKWCN